MNHVPAPVGHTPKDRDSLLQAAALVEGHLSDDVQAVGALTLGQTAEDVAGLVVAFLTLFEAAHARDPEMVAALLAETRAANLSGVDGP